VKGIFKVSMKPSIGKPILRVNRYSNSLRGDNIGMSIGSRIREARQAAGLTQKALAQKVGMAQGSLSALETGDSQGTTMIATMAAALGVSPLWLETGRGPMKGSEERDPLLGLKPGTFMRVEAVDEGDPRMALIPRVRLRLRAGISGFEVEPEPSEDASWMIPTAWIHAKGFKRENLISIGIHGDSMDDKLCDGDSVIINTADKDPADGVIFAINYEGEPVVKRMMRDAGHWWLTSDNPDQRKYPRKICEGERCLIIGRVVKRETEKL
jgi:phage repressor protein C with HTH and peptisase S24 domain